MNAVRQRMTNAQHRTESIGARTQMRDLAEEFQRMSFLLKRKTFIGRSEHFDFLCLYLG